MIGGGKALFDLSKGVRDSLEVVLFEKVEDRFMGRSVLALSLLNV